MYEKINSEYIAALDLGTSKIIAAACAKNKDKGISAIALEQENSETCIRRGCVYNVDEASKKISNLIRELNKKLPQPIEKIYVGIGGQSLKTETYAVYIDNPMETPVSETMVQSLLDKCKEYKPDFFDVLDIVSPEYFLDGRPEKKPVGIRCKKIEARFQLILGRPSIKRNLQTCIAENNKIEIAGYIISPLAVADAILTDTEKNLGCALIEFGAGVTYLSVYKDGFLKYLATIPLGGNVITKDICSLNIPEDEAENLKIKYGSAFVEANSDDSKLTIKLSQTNHYQKTIEVEELNNIIESRVDEILANVNHQIEISGYSGSLGAGIIITGGGASLKNLPESVEDKTKQKARIISPEKSLLLSTEKTHFSFNKLGKEEIIGLLHLGKENCGKVVKQTITEPGPGIFKQEEIEVKKAEPTTSQGNKERGGRKEPEPPKPKGPGFFEKIKGTVEGFSKNLFEEE